MNSLKERYSTHEVPRSIQEKLLEDKYLVLFNMEDNCKELERLQAKNKRQILINKVLQKMMPSYKEFLTKDGELLKEIDHLYTCTIQMIEPLFECVNSSNYLEIIKLIDFILVLYSDNYNVIGSKRRSLRFNKRGIDFIDNRFEDTREEIDEFYQDELLKFQKNKVLEKK